MKERHYLGISSEGFHKVAYTEWGKPNRERALICVHGLTRNRHDFDYLSKALSKDHYIACPDVPGRGDSDYFMDPKHYGYEQYIADMNALIARLDVEAVDWLGTSMGGLFGIVMAALPKTPIRRLILNDIGPFIPRAAVDRIEQYAGTTIEFSDYAQAKSVLRQIYEPFGKLKEDQWEYLISHSVKKQDKKYVLAYDPHATRGVEGQKEDAPVVQEDEERNVVFWEMWEKITCPVLVINGKYSDILPAHVVEEMRKRGPKFEHVMIEDAGHAPALMADDQIEMVREWLARTT